MSHSRRETIISVGGRGQERAQGKGPLAGQEEALEGRVAHRPELRGPLCLQETSWGLGSACSMA